MLAQSSLARWGPRSTQRWKRTGVRCGRQVHGGSHVLLSESFQVSRMLEKINKWQWWVRFSWHGTVNYLIHHIIIVLESLIAFCHAAICLVSPKYGRTRSLLQIWHLAAGRHGEYADVCKQPRSHHTSWWSSLSGLAQRRYGNMVVLLQPASRNKNIGNVLVWKGSSCFKFVKKIASLGLNVSPFYGTTSPMAGFGFGHSAGPGGYVGGPERIYI